MHQDIQMNLLVAGLAEMEYLLADAIAEFQWSPDDLQSQTQLQELHIPQRKKNRLLQIVQSGNPPELIRRQCRRVLQCQSLHEAPIQFLVTDVLGKRRQLDRHTQIIGLTLMRTERLRR